MKNYVIIFTLCFFIISISYSFASNQIITPTVEAYCVHRGYTLEINEDENGDLINAFCIFNESEKCDIFEFYSGKCDTKYLTEVNCRTQGQVVFTSFEVCCEGLEPTNENSAINLPTCEPKPKLFQIIWRGFFGLFK